MTFLPCQPRLPEALFRRQVERYAEQQGWHWHDLGDSLAFVRRPRIVFVKLKGQRTPLTADQREWVADLRACGQEVYVFRSSMWRQVERILR